MRELANICESRIDEASIIQYVINGIDGPRSYKRILYDATSFSEFKQKLCTYETVLKNMGIHNSKSPNFRHSYESRGRYFKQQSFQRKPTRFNVSDAAKNPQRCFNCNDIGHLSKSCPNHSRGPRCISCNLYGHKSFECRRANFNNTSTPPSGVNAVHKLPSAINMCKDVTIFGRKLNGLVDTGSNLILLRNSTYINIDAPPLKQTNTLLTGFGFSQINVIGTFDSEITIDDQIFPITVSVVPNSCTNYDFIIGCDVIKQAHLNISPVVFPPFTRRRTVLPSEKGRLFPSSSKTKAVINYPDLKNIKDIRRFLGLTGYFRKFLPSYSTIAKPLSDLIRKDSLFQFYAEQQTAFQKLKYLLSQQPVLSIFNQNSPTEIHTDASIDGLGAVLLQKSIHDNQFHPVFYMSKKISDHERKYTSFELEVLAVVEVLKKFRIYVLGTSFKIITDCDALVKTLSKKELNPRIARWALYFHEFNYTIEHRTGSKMAHVDTLSRPTHCMLIQNGVHLQFLKAQQADDQITTIKTLLETSPHDNYIVKNKLLYKTVNGTDLLVVPDEMQANIIKTAHERGHFAVLRTQDLVSKEFYIPRLKDKFKKCIQNCVTCILTNRKREVINRLENQRQVFGNPARIITDKGSAFSSSAFEDYCEKQNILHISITTGLPRSNGQIEKQNSTIIAVLSKPSVDDPEKWYSHVPRLQEILNSTFQRSIKMTPFEFLFGTKMKSCQDIEIVELLNDEITAQF
ncbi:transposon Tf2-8 polyprotein [Trichonephila clavipes]|nr:transposon Tf2-8 polyprotein [Trichonephila clavipes]